LPLLASNGSPLRQHRASCGRSSLAALGEFGLARRSVFGAVERIGGFAPISLPLFEG